MATDSIRKVTRLLMQLMQKVTTLLMQLMWTVARPEDLKVGDHIYTYGLYGLYSHHGIYVDDGYVVHFTRTENKKTACPSLSKTSHEQQSCPNRECENHETVKRGVVKTCLDCFRRDGNKLRSLHCYGYGWPRLGVTLARPGTCTILRGIKSSQQVVQKATELHRDNSFGDYSLMNNNCEHFALFCQTNIRKSEQTAFFSNCERKTTEAKEWTMRLLQRN